MFKTIRVILSIFLLLRTKGIEDVGKYAEFVQELWHTLEVFA